LLPLSRAARLTKGKKFRESARGRGGQGRGEERETRGSGRRRGHGVGFGVCSAVGARRGETGELQKLKVRKL